MSVLADLVPIVIVCVSRELDQGEIGQGGVLLEGLFFERLDDYWHLACAVGNRAQTVLLEETIEHLCSVKACLLEQVVVVFELDIETDSGVAVDSARGISVPHIDVVNQLLQSQDLELVVEDLRACAVPLLTLECLQLDQGEVKRIELSIKVLPVTVDVFILGNVCSVVQVGIMLADQISVFGQLQVHLDEVCASIVSIFVTGK